MQAWWEGMTAFQQSMFVIAAATTLFMIVQIVMMLIGIGSEDSFDAETDMDVDTGDVINDESFTSMGGLKLISVRTVIAFLCVGSWMTYAMSFVMPLWGAIPLGIVTGAAAGVAVAFAMRALMRLQDNGNLDHKACVGQTGEVYVRIPAAKEGAGKINVYLEERYVELDAVTEDVEPIATGKLVRVVGLIGQTALVERAIAAEPTAQA